MLWFSCFIYNENHKKTGGKNNNRKSDNNCQIKRANNPETGILAEELTGSYIESQFFSFSSPKCSSVT